VGKNPPNGALLSLYLEEKPGEKETLTVEVRDGEEILRTYTSKKKEEEGEKGEEGAGGEREEEPEEKPLEPKAGLNRVVWDLRIGKPALLPKAVIWGVDRGPRVGPGSYTVRVKLGSRAVTQKIEVRPHPGVPVTADDLQAQFRLLRDLRDGLSRAHQAVRQIRDVKAQSRSIGERAEKLGKGPTLREKAKALGEKLTEIEKKLVNPEIKSGQDVLNFPPALDHQFAGLAGAVSSADAKPTDASQAFYRQIRAELDAILARLDAALVKDLGAFNEAVRQAQIPPVVVVKAEKPGGD
jgi:hypothetical protein